MIRDQASVGSFLNLPGVSTAPADMTLKALNAAIHPILQIL
jgi:hypothetical protein